MLTLLLLLILVSLFVSPAAPWASGWSLAPSGIGGVLVLCFVLYLLFGHRGPVGWGW